MQWILSRGLCLYRPFKVKDIPAADYQNALQLKIRQWSPFEETGQYMAWQDDTVQVWIWDAAGQKRAAEEMAVKKARPIPETLLHPPASSDGMRLLSCLDGVEGQFWRDGRLRAARWWPAFPSAAEWTLFQRACQLPATPLPAAPQALSWLEKPWLKAQRNLNLYRLDAKHKQLGWQLALCLLCAAAGWQLAALWQWRSANAALREEIAALTAQVEPLLTAREKALDHQSAIERLLALAPYPKQLPMMAAIAEKFPDASSARLLEWRYGIDTLDFTLQGDNLDPRVYVANFQTMPYFHDVTTQAGRQADQLQISLRLLPQKAQP